MGVVLGFMGICVFCVAPITLENAQHRIDAAIRAEFENYNRDVNAQNDQSNQFDETQQEKFFILPRSLNLKKIMVKLKYLTW